MEGEFRPNIQRIDSRIHEGSISIHIEPFYIADKLRLDLTILEKKISQLVEESTFLHDFHSYECHLLPSGVIISFHCYASPDLSISAIHKASNLLEIAIKNEIDEHSQIYIFVEPTPNSQEALE